MLIRNTQFLIAITKLVNLFHRSIFLDPSPSYLFLKTTLIKVIVSPLSSIFLF